MPLWASNSESAQEGTEWFRSYNHTGAKGSYLESVYRIQNYMFDPTRWGLTRRSSRTKQAPDRLSQQPSPTATPIASIPTPTPTPSPSSLKPNTRKRARSSSSSPPPSSSPSKRPKTDSSLPPEALAILRPPPNPTPPEYDCLHCHKPPSDPTCTISCYHAFRAKHFSPALSKLQIRRTDPGANDTGLGIYILPGQAFRAGDWLGEYLGELLPATAPEADTSDYAFTMAGCANSGVQEVVVDAQTHGNWTRFLNSSCKPNAEALPEQVGGVKIIAVRARKRIRAGEQVCISYGRRYFEGRKMMCLCETKDGPHLPPEMK